LPLPLLIGDELHVINDKGVALLTQRAEDALDAARIGGNFSASPIFLDGKIISRRGWGDDSDSPEGSNSKSWRQAKGSHAASFAIDGKESVRTQNLLLDRSAAGVVGRNLN
jgi:hypothetical protein